MVIRCEYCGTEFENKDEYGVIHIVKEKTTKNQPYTRFYTHYPPKKTLFREKIIVNLRMYVLCKMLKVSHF